MVYHGSFVSRPSVGWPMNKFTEPGAVPFCPNITCERAKFGVCSCSFLFVPLPHPRTEFLCTFACLILIKKDATHFSATTLRPTPTHFPCSPGPILFACTSCTSNRHTRPTDSTRHNTSTPLLPLLPPPSFSTSLFHVQRATLRLAQQTTRTQAHHTCRRTT